MGSNHWRGLSLLISLMACGETQALEGLSGDLGVASEDGATSDVGEVVVADTGINPGSDLGSIEADGGVGSDAGGATSVPDPELPGPFRIRTSQSDIVAPSGNSVPLDCRVPIGGPEGAPYPAVLIGPGFQIPAEQYLGYAERLATFGYVTCIVDFPTGFVANHAENARDFVAAVDWLFESTTQRGHPLAGQVDTTRVGAAGHSLGGKVAVIAAAEDVRIRAVLGIDPVDSSLLCPPSRCPDASNMLPLPIPIALLGETVDATGPLQACAPAADNFQTFFSAADAPALEVEVLGANHVSFLDDPDACGLPCRVCNEASAPHADVIGLARAYAAAFFERHLRGLVAYDAYLDGQVAVSRYVMPGLAQIRTK